MESDAKEKRSPAPYISWRTFTSFIANMKGKLPAQIDNSVLTNMSGTGRSQLLSALRFLGLVQADGTVTDELKRLSDQHNTAEWKSRVGALFEVRYSTIVGKMNMVTATPAMLRDRFKNFGGIEGGTIDNAVRFYLAGLKEAEIPFSPHLIVRASRSGSTGPRKRQSAGKSEGYTEPDEVPEGMFEIDFALLKVDGSACLPENISLEQWGAINEYVRFVIDLRQKAQGDT